MPVQIDMEMPRSCEVCDCLYRHRDMITGFCPFTGHFVNFGDGREVGCPLVEAKEQKWHVVAEGDLPEEVGNYLVTVERTFFSGKYPRGRVVREVLQAYFKRDDSYIVGYVWWSDCAGLDDRDVLAWRELPEPWEGAVK